MCHSKVVRFDRFCLRIVIFTFNVSSECTEESDIDWVHTRRTGERSHKPVVDAVHVVGMQTWQKSNTVAF